MSVIPEIRRRKLARTISAAGLAAALSGSALVGGALLPTASAAVDPGDPVPGTIYQDGDGSARAVCERLLESEDLVALYSKGGGDAANEYFAGTSDIAENDLDVAVVDPEYKVLGVYVRGPHRNYHAFEGDPYLEGDDLLDMYAPEGPSAATLSEEAKAELKTPDADDLAQGEDIVTSDYNKDGYDEDKKINHWLICGEKVEKEEPEPDLGVLAPICDGDVPYLEYAVDPQGADVEDGDVTITWINPDGDDVVYEDLPLEGRALWAGAVIDEEGNPLDWPGWTQLEDDTWVEGDEFDWVRPSADILFEVNPEFELTVDYPPSSPDCDANPPQNGDEPTLPETGASANLAATGAALLVGGGVLLLASRRRVGSQS